MCAHALTKNQKEHNMSLFYWAQNLERNWTYKLPWAGAGVWMDAATIAAGRPIGAGASCGELRLNGGG